MELLVYPITTPPTPFSFSISQLSIPQFPEQLDGDGDNLEKLSLRYNPLQQLPHYRQQSLSRHPLLARLHPTKMRCLLICGWGGCFKGKLEPTSGRETSLVRAKHAAQGFNGGPAWFPQPPPSATHWHQFKPQCHHHGTWLHSHTNAPCEHPTMAKATRADPERARGA